MVTRDTAADVMTCVQLKISCLNVRRSGTLRRSYYCNQQIHHAHGRLIIGVSVYSTQTLPLQIGQGKSRGPQSRFYFHRARIRKSKPNVFHTNHERRQTPSEPLRGVLSLRTFKYIGCQWTSTTTSARSHTIQAGSPPVQLQAGQVCTSMDYIVDIQMYELIG